MQFCNLSFFFFFSFLAERYVCGVGENITKESILKREVIHRLYISPLSHSEIVKQLKVIIHTYIF